MSNKDTKTNEKGNPLRKLYDYFDEANYVSPKAMKFLMNKLRSKKPYVLMSKACKSK